MGREENGFIYLGRYKYARKLQNGKYSLYEGYWGRGEHQTVGLQVVRGDDDKPMRFNTLEAVKEYYGWH